MRLNVRRVSDEVAGSDLQDYTPTIFVIFCRHLLTARFLFRVRMFSLWKSSSTSHGLSGSSLWTLSCWSLGPVMAG